MEWKKVTLLAAYGLGTIEGLRHIAVVNCDSNGKFTKTGQMLDRFVNRLMWILDYANATMPVIEGVVMMLGPPCTKTVEVKGSRCISFSRHIDTIYRQS